MAIRRWLTAMLCAVTMLFLSASPVFAAINTMPDLPELTGKPIQEEVVLPAVPEGEEQLSAEQQMTPVNSQDDSRMIMIGIACWAAFLIVGGIVTVIIIRVKKNPPGGTTPNSRGKLGRETPDSAAYKERMLNDQHYRRY